MIKRTQTPRQTEKRVLLSSKRRCCFCFGLSNDLKVKRGQVAHLDKNRSNHSFENLAWMCLDHHDQYDSRTSQSRGLSLQEAKTYRDHLYLFLEEKRAEGIKSFGKLPYQPAVEMEYSARENQKRVAYGLLRSPATEDKRTGLIMLIEAHFQRQPKTLVSNFKVYAAHWLHANSKEFAPEVVAELVAEYGAPKYPRIKSGYSDWGSYGDPNYCD